MRQNIYEQNGYCIFADCYNASPDAMEAALKVLGGMAEGGRRFAVLGSMLELGGYAEEGSHRRAGRAAAEKRRRACMPMGRTRTRWSQARRSAAWPRRMR